MVISDIKIKDIIKENRKTISATVFPDGSVVIKTPIDATNDKINDFIKRKKQWIRDKIEYFNQFKISDKKANLSGSSILYLGRQYQFIIQKSGLNDLIKIEKNKIVFYSSHPQKIDEINKVFDKWLLNKSEQIFSDRLKELMKTFDFPTPTLKVRKLNKRWGSYLKKHEIILNPALIQASKKAIDYIITHELCHHYYENHSTEFYKLLSSKIPNWQEIENKLESRLLGKY
ncbi:MAG: M48 family metallopeptidase [Alphaproteobacteria bacterium]|nr:M48 family metallopeptidase [Alphaproteobacteria bacterium]